MVDERTKKELKDLPILEEPQLYIYVLLNSAGKVKVGKTTNVAQRIQSLSGSNSAGNPIIKCWVSVPTYLYSLETLMHRKMEKFRIPNTEWFYYEDNPTGERLYSSAIHVLNKLMNSKDFHKCNKVRKLFYEKKEN